MADETAPLLRMLPMFRTLSELSDMQRAAYVAQYVQEARKEGSGLVIEKVEIAWKCIGCGGIQAKKIYSTIAMLDASATEACQKCGTEVVLDLVVGMRRINKTKS